MRTDDLAAIPLRALRDELQKSDWESVDEVIFGCTNQAGEDNRNVARMALLLSGIPYTVPAMTVNRLCGSGMEAVTVAARAIGAGEISLAIAGGVESMSRAPFVMPKAAAAFSRTAEIYDTTIGWRFPNPRMVQLYGNASMPETAENVAEKYKVDPRGAGLLWRCAPGMLKAAAYAQRGRNFRRGNCSGTDSRPKGYGEDCFRGRTHSPGYDH